MNTLNHLAIIMDGNGRWAKKNHFPRTAGHYKGVEVLRNITIYANRLGIKYLTVYAFSTENWKRSVDEVKYIMSLPKIFFSSYIDELMENNVKIMIIGDRDKIPAETLAVIDKAIERTGNNTGLVLNFAFNYGSRDEIIKATKKYALDYSKGLVKDISEESFNDYLYTSNLPDPDLLIRTGGQKRLSNFLLYQLAYAEIIVIDDLWPDFTNDILNQCIDEYQNRKRNFGGRDEAKDN